MTKLIRIERCLGGSLGKRSSTVPVKALFYSWREYLSKVDQNEAMGINQSEILRCFTKIKGAVQLGLAR